MKQWRILTPPTDWRLGSRQNLHAGSVRYVAQQPFQVAGCRRFPASRCSGRGACQSRGNSPWNDATSYFKLRKKR